MHQPHSFKIPVTKTGEFVSAELIMPLQAKAILVLAHGAGAGMNHAFMISLVNALASLEVASIRYNFLYMEKGRRRPDLPGVATETVKAAINHTKEMLPDVPVFAGGKSYGGRMTSQCISANERELCYVKGIVFYGFPLHPAAKPSLTRADHLHLVHLPMLFLQGDKDKLAKPDLISSVCSSLPTASLVLFEGTDHSFTAGKKKNVVSTLAATTEQWMKKLL